VASTPKKSNKASSTCIPFFDIEFRNILAHLSKNTHKIEKIKEENITLRSIEENIEIFRSIFGFKHHTMSISELRNQSTHDLGRPSDLH
jgi:hypothetical protein